MKSVLLILAMALGVEPGRDLLQPEPTTLPAGFGKTFVGRLGGKHEVRMHLDRKNGSLSGRYSYVNVEDSLRTERPDSEQRSVHARRVRLRTPHGRVQGTLVRHILKGGSLLKLSGTWESAEGRKPLPFEHVEEHLMVDGEPVVYSTAAIEEENAKLG